MLLGEDGIIVNISQGAADFIVAEAQNWHPKETGGVLVGYVKDGHFNIEYAIGPGPGATHKRAFFQRDQEYSECQVEMIHTQSGGNFDYLGELHSHSRRQGPSMTDVSSMIRIRSEASNNCPQPLLVIVMQHHGSWIFSAFIPDPMMRTRDICALPVEAIAASDSVLFLWAIHSHLPDALAVIKAWGFTYKTVAFTWVKRTPRDTGYFLGRGYWTRSNAEPCLLATRGHPRRMGTGVSSLIVSPRREHSRKPDEARDRIVSICGNVPRAELFARQKVTGWSAWGNEVECDFLF